MAALGILHQANTAGYTSSASATFDDVGSGLTLGASGKTYAIIVVAQISADNVNHEHEYQVTADGTVLPGAFTAWEADAISGYQTWGYCKKYTTTNSSEVVKFQFNGTTTPYKAYCNTVTITAIPLDGLAATDWYYAEDDDESAPTTLGASDQASWASVTFTPGNNNDHWLAIGTANIGINDASTNYRVGIKESVGATTDPYISVEGEDGSPSEVEKRIAQVSRVFTLSNASHTISTWADDDGSGVHSHRWSSIFCLRLEAFEKIAYGYNNTKVDIATANTWEQQMTTSFTPDTTGPVFGFVSLNYDIASSGNATKLKVELDNTTVYPTNSESVTSTTGYDNTDIPGASCAVYVSSLTASTAYTFDVDAQGDATTVDIYGRSYAFFSDELAGGGAPAYIPKVSIF